MAKTRAEQIKEKSRELQYRTAKLSNPFANNVVNFNPVQANMSRYLTYGSKVYGQLGFDPTRDNNKLYNSKTGGIDDISRAFEGSLKLAKIGFGDTFAFGTLGNKNSSFDFEKTMNDYGSTRGGFSGFFSNTLLSSGYKAGILGAIAAEEIGLTALTALTALSGGAGAGLQAAETANLGSKLSKLFRGGTRTMNATLRNVAEVSDVNRARTIFQKTGGFLSPLNPLENTTEFVKNFSKIEDVSKTVVGAGALVRDMRKLYMTHSESKLEAEMGEREFFKTEYDKALAKSVDGVLDSKTVEQIKLKAKNVHDKIYTGNLGLIYATNAIAFDNMFKSMKGTNRFFNVLDNGLFKVVKDPVTKKVTFVALENPIKGFKKYLMKQGKELTTLKGWGNTVLSSSLEGFQELGQDVLSSAVKKYYGNQKEVEQVKGGLLSQAFDDIKTLVDSDFLKEVGTESKNMLSVQGLETFMSGALMGAFASPVGLATQGVNSFLFEGGIDNLKNVFIEQKGLNVENQKAYNSRKEKAKILTEFYNRTKNFTDFIEHPLLAQHESQADIMDAARDKDKLRFNNAQEKSFVDGLWTMLESGLEEDFKNHLKYMAENFSVNELQEVFGREDITAENANKFREKLYGRVKKVDEYKKRFDAVNIEFKNPINLGKLSPKDDSFLDQYLQWKAYDSLRKEMVSSLGMIKDHSDRLLQLSDTISNAFKTEDNITMGQFYDSNVVQSEIDLLDASVKAESSLDLDEYGKIKLNQKKDRLKKLKAYKSSLDRLQKANATGKKVIVTKEKMYQAFKELSSLTDENKNRTVFEEILDYLDLKSNVASYEKYSEVLTGFESRKTIANLRFKLMKELDANKQVHIEKVLEEYEKKKVSDEMLNELYNAGLFFNLKELDDLLKDGQLPEEFYDINNSTLATKEQKIKAQEIVKRFVKKLKNMELLEKDATDTNKSGKRATIDKRVVAGLLRQFGIKKNTPIDLSTAEGKEFLQKLLDSKYLFTADEAILYKFLENDFGPVNLVFVTDQDSAIDFNTEGDVNTFSIDLRYASSEYKVSQFTSFESLVTRALTQHIIHNVFDKMDVNLLNDVMVEIRDYLKDRTPVTMVPFLNDPKLFLSEVLNNLEFQKALEGLQLSTAIEEESSWDDMISGINSLLKENFEGKALRKITALISNAFNGEVVEDVLPAEKTATNKVATSTETKIESVRYNFENDNLQNIDINPTREGFKGDFLNDYDFLAQGSEHTVYRSKDGKTVIKIGEPYGSNEGFMPRVKDALTISNLIGDGSLEVIGYYESNGVKNPVYQQNYVDGKTMTQEEVKSHLESKGFINLSNDSFGIKVDGKYYEIFDTSDNFIIDKKGNISAIDAGIMELDLTKLTEEQRLKLEETQKASEKPAEKTTTTENVSDVQTISTETENTISSLESELTLLQLQSKEIINRKKANGKLSSRDSRLLTLLGFKIEEIISELEKLKASTEETLPADPLQPVINYQPQFDKFNNLLYDINTPWASIPSDLKIELIQAVFPEQFSNPLMQATADDIRLILEDLKINPYLQQIIVDYNNKITEKSEIEFNKNAIELAAPVKPFAKVRTKRKLNFIENLERKLGSDFSLLTEKEINDLKKQLENSKNSIYPFTFQDIVNYVQSKKNKIALEEQKKKTKKDIELNKTIRKNFKKAVPGKWKVLKSTGPRGGVNLGVVLVSPDLMEYFKLTNKDVFKTDPDLFLEAFNALLRNYIHDRNFAKALIQNAKSEQDLIDLFLTFQKDKMLFPYVAKALNEKFRDLNSNLRIYKDRTNSGLFYNLTAAKVSVKPRAKSIKITPKQKKLNILQSQIDTVYNPSDRNTALALITVLLQTKGFTKELLSKIYSPSELKKKRGFISKNNPAKSLDGFIDLLEDYTKDDDGSGLIDFNNYSHASALMAALEEILDKYNSPSEALNEVSKRIEEDRINNDEEFFSIEDTQEFSADDYLFFHSPEGNQILEQMYLEQSEYYNSIEFKIENGLYFGKFSELNERQQNLYKDAVTLGYYKETQTESIIKEITELTEKLMDLQQSEEYQNGEHESVSRALELEENIKDLKEFITLDFELEFAAAEQKNNEDNAKSQLMLEVEKFKLMQLTSGDFIKTLNDIIKDPNTSFFTLTALAKFINSSDYNYKNEILNKITSSLKRNDFVNQAVVLNGEIYFFNKVEKKKGVLQISLKTLNQETVSFSFDDFLNIYETSVNPGEEIGESSLDVKVEDSQLDYAKKLFADNFGIFDTTESDPEQTKTALIEHLKNC